jgi:hypothetical protein
VSGSGTSLLTLLLMTRSFDLVKNRSHAPTPWPDLRSARPVINRVLDCLFSDSSAETTQRACQAIKRLGHAASDCLVERLTAMLREADSQKPACWVQASIPLILARLEELEADPDGSVRYYAGNALQSLRPEHLLVSAAG